MRVVAEGCVAFSGCRVMLGMIDHFENVLVVMEYSSREGWKMPVFKA